jgi:uncharacterized protein (TIGR02569 family)
MTIENVPQDVLDAFQCDGTPERLAGGEGYSFIVDQTVFKPIHNVERYAWGCDLLLRIPQTGFRLSLPRRTRRQGFTHAGWGATSYEPGEAIRGRWTEKLAVCRAFHAALPTDDLSPMPPSADPWTQAHQIVWQEVDLPDTVDPEIRQLLEALFARCQPLARPKRVIHSDLCGNILFAAGLAPLVIDFSPTYGPLEYAAAILVADAIAWEDAPIELTQELPRTAYSHQMLIRAVNFRLVVAALFFQDKVRFKRAYADFAPLLEYLTRAAGP